MGELFGLCGILTVPVVVVAAWILRKAMLKMAIRFVLRVLYRVEVIGIEHARAAQSHAVIAANHASFLDGMLLGAFLPGTPVFAINTFVAEKWWVKPFLSLVNAMPIDPTNPLSLRGMIRAVEGGAVCIIFPEGRITTTGSLMKVYEGPAVITEHAKALARPGAYRRRRAHAVLALHGRAQALVPAHSHHRDAAAQADGARRRDRRGPPGGAAP